MKLVQSILQLLNKKDVYKSIALRSRIIRNYSILPIERQKLEKDVYLKEENEWQQEGYSLLPIINKYLISGEIVKSIETLDLFLFQSNKKVEVESISLVLKAIIQKYKIRDKDNVFIKEEAIVLMDKIYKSIKINNIDMQLGWLNAFIYFYSMLNVPNMIKVNKILEENVMQYDIITYSNIILGYTRINKMKQVRKVYRYIQYEAKLEANLYTYSIIILGCIKNNKLNMAMKYYYLMLKHIQPNNYIYTHLIYAFLKCREPNQAVQLYSNLLQQQLTPNLHCLETLIVGLCINDNIELALLGFNELIKFNYQPSQKIYSNLLNTFSKENKNLLFPFWKLYLESNPKPDATVLNGFYSAFVKVDEQSIANQILSIIKDE